jgi:DNA-directed RNA polymerase specialized sigma subunit
MGQDINQIYYIMELVDQLEEQKHRTVIYLRYFEGKTAGEIATQIQFNERYVFRILREAIQELDKILKDSVCEDGLQTTSSH